MEATKEQMVDFIYNNFSSSGKKITKKYLNKQPVEELEEVIRRNNCEERLMNWINRPKLIKFMVDGVQDGKTLGWDIEATDEEEVRRQAEEDGITIERIVKASTHHRCMYCGSIAEGRQKNVLCDDCQETFAHTYYDEL